MREKNIDRALPACERAPNHALKAANRRLTARHPSRGRGPTRDIHSSLKAALDSPAWRLVEANPRLRRHAPLFGEHNREILCGLLGHAGSELAELESAHVIGSAPIGASAG